MTRRRLVHGICALGLLGLAAYEACSQEYPARPIRVVTGSVGSSADLIARLIAQDIAGPLGQQVIVDSRSGGVVPGQMVASAVADGYTLLLFGGTIWLGSFFEKFPFDPLKDLAPIVLTSEQTNILVVHPSLPVKSVKDLIGLANARPGALNCAMGGKGGAAYLAAELFKAMANVNIVSVPFKGVGPAVTGVIGGEVQLMFSTAGSVEAHVKSGRLRALAVTSAQPSVLVPGLPTVAATVPGYSSVGNHAMFAPAKTPARIVERLNREIVRALSQPDLRQKLLKIGIEPLGGSPDQLAAYLQSEITRLGSALKNAGVHPE
jgi:tripartite-type tricarboxylate transporter receptor subunit TctC